MKKLILLTCVMIGSGCGVSQLFSWLTTPTACSDEANDLILSLELSDKWTISSPFLNKNSMLTKEKMSIDISDGRDNMFADVYCNAKRINDQFTLGELRAIRDVAQKRWVKVVKSEIKK